MMYVISYLIIGCVIAIVSFRKAEKKGLYRSLVTESEHGEKGMFITIIFLWFPLIVFIMMMMR